MRWCCLIALVAAGAASAQPPPPGLPTVRDVVRAAVARGTIPGAVVYVAQNGRPVMFEALGDAEPGPR